MLYVDYNTKCIICTKIKNKDFVKFSYFIQLSIKVVELSKDENGYKTISKVLKIPVSTVQSFNKKWKIQGSLDTKPR